MYSCVMAGRVDTSPFLVLAKAVISKRVVEDEDTAKESVSKKLIEYTHFLHSQRTKDGEDLLLFKLCEHRQVIRAR